MESESTSTSKPTSINRGCRRVSHFLPMSSDQPLRSRYPGLRISAYCGRSRRNGGDRSSGSRGNLAFPTAIHDRVASRSGYVISMTRWETPYPISDPYILMTWQYHAAGSPGDRILRGPHQRRLRYQRLVDLCIPRPDLSPCMSRRATLPLPVAIVNGSGVVPVTEHLLRFPEGPVPLI